MGRSIKMIEVNSTVADAVSAAFSDLQSLGEEIREVVDNASEGLSQTQRIQTLDETAGTLENLGDEPDVPESLKDVKVKYHEAQSTRKGRGLSRSNRCSNACAMLRAVEEALSESDYDDNDDAQELLQTCTNAADEAEGCEFPGMYG